MVVDKQPDTYKRPIDPTVTNKFWGTEDRDDVVQNVHLEKSKKAFYGLDGKDAMTTTQRRKAEQSAA